MKESYMHINIVELLQANTGTYRQCAMNIFICTHMQKSSTHIANRNTEIFKDAHPDTYNHPSHLYTRVTRVSMHILALSGI